MTNSAARLDAEQRELWDFLRLHEPKPSAGMTAERAINLGVLTFLFWCDFDGVGAANPTREAIEAEFTARGAAEVAPGTEFWELLEREPGYPWILAPGARVDAWDLELFGRPTRYVMERP